MAIETYQFLNQAGVEKLATELLGKVNLRIAERIVTEVSETSSDKVVPSAKTVYDLLAAANAASADLKTRVDGHDTTLGEHGDSISALQTSQGEQDTKIGTLETDLAALSKTVDDLTHLTIETVTGSIDTVTTPATDKLYLQRDNESDKTWMLYVYQESANPDAYDASKYFTTDGAGTITGLTDEAKAATELIIPTEISGVAVTAIADNVFADAASLTTVNFVGTEEQWNAITVGTTGNDPLTAATKTYEYTLPAATVGTWINVGDTEVDLSNYWSKDSIDEMKEALGMHDAEPIPDETVVSSVEAAFTATAVDLTDSTEEEETV